MFLIDTNIFLEILLEQEKKEDCKKFLNDHIGNLHITDFSLHSIGVILFKQGVAPARCKMNNSNDIKILFYN